MKITVGKRGANPTCQSTSQGYQNELLHLPAPYTLIETCLTLKLQNRLGPRKDLETCYLHNQNGSQLSHVMY